MSSDLQKLPCLAVSIFGQNIEHSDIFYTAEESASRSTPLEKNMATFSKVECMYNL